MGICYSDGFIVDFLGPRFVHRGSLGFGNVARYWRLDPGRVTEGGSTREGYDAALRRAEAFFNAGEDYNLFGNNCHQFAAHAMNLMAYDSKRNWNMVHLAASVLLRGKWVDGWWGPIKYYGPFVAGMTTSIAMGWWALVTGVCGTFAALVAYFVLYSFAILSLIHI